MDIDAAIWYNGCVVSICGHMVYAEEKKWIFVRMWIGLARWVLKFHAKLVGFLKKIIASEDFLSRHRVSPSDFTRQRKLPFSTMVVFLMNQLRASLQTELDRFFKVIESADLPIRRVTKSAACQARKKFSHEVFVDLRRRAVEWFYRHVAVKRSKCRMEIERFTGYSAHSVYQDFHATILLGNLTSMLSYSAREEIETEHPQRVHPRRMNWTQALGKMKDTIVLLFLRDSIHSILEKLIRCFRSSWETFRSNRSFPRRKRPQKRIFHMAYKPTY